MNHRQNESNDSRRSTYPSAHERLLSAAFAGRLDLADN